MATETPHTTAIAVLKAKIDEEYEQGRDAPELWRAVTALYAALDLLAATQQAREALRLTREYVGEDALPAIEGWSWYDADNALRTAIDAATA